MMQRESENRLFIDMRDHIAKLTVHMEEANVEMKRLEESIRSASGIVDPNLKQAKEVLKELKRIIPEINSQWAIIVKAKAQIDAQEEKHPSPEEGKKIRKRRRYLNKAIRSLVVVVRGTKNILRKITHSLVATEKNLELNGEDIDFLNHSTSNLNRDIDELMEQYHRLKRETNHISRLEIAKKVSTYLTYGTAATKAGVTAWLVAWVETLKQATQAVGTIFYPISASFTTLIQLLSLGSRIVQYRVAHKELSDDSITDERRKELEYARSELRKSIALRTLASVLNAISIAAGIIAMFTPFGAAIIAAASFTVWIDERYRPYRRAMQAIKEFDLANTEPLSEEARLERDARKDRAQVKKTEAIWTGAPILGLALMACAPIPIAGPIIALVGGGIVGVATARNTYVVVKQLYIDRKIKARRAKKGIDSDLDSNAIELKEVRKKSLEKSPLLRLMNPSPSVKTITADNTTEHAENTLSSRAQEQPSGSSRISSGLFSSTPAANDPAIIKPASPTHHSTPPKQGGATPSQK